MRRKILQQLKEWKEQDQGATALMLDGARRVGKSYTALEFAKENYKTYLLIDFNLVDDKVKDLFEHDLLDLNKFFMHLSIYYGVKLYPRQTLIIFDEVQLFPRARAAIKYLVADGRYDYLETGSLLSIKRNVQNIVLPSEERHLRMYPMDFEEFLWALGDELLYPYIQDCFAKIKPLGAALHRKAMTLFREYMLVGGMPQAIQTYVETRDFAKVDRVKRNILDLYRGDIVKYAQGYEHKVAALFDAIPSQLDKHEKKFKFSSLGKEARLRQYEEALFWLEDAMIVNLCFNTTAPGPGLRMNSVRSSLKCYMGDTGLLISSAFDSNGSTPPEIYKKLLFDKLEMNKGMLVENIVAQMLVASAHKLYFYSASSQVAEDRMEIDFLLTKRRLTSRRNISVVEVKSGQRYTLSSLNKYRTKYARQVEKAYVVHPEDVKEEDGVIYLPLYMTSML